MQRAYSDMDGDEGVARRIAGEVEEAERNGSKHTLEVRYVRMPDMVVKAIDNATGEETLIKRSGSCLVMRSDDGSLGVMRRHVLSAEKYVPFDVASEMFGARLSPHMRDMMFADVYGTGKRVTYNIGVEEKRKLKDQIEEKEKQLDKVEGQLDEIKNNPNNQVVTDLGIETDAGVKDKIDELTAKRDLLKAGIDGKKAMSIGDHHAMDKAVQDTFRANDRLDVIDRNKERLKKSADDRNGFDGGSGMDKYKGYGGKGVGNTRNAMQVRTESYVSDIGGGEDERLFASRYVTSRRFQYGTTLSKNAPAVSGRQGSGGQNKPPSPQNSQNSTQNDGKPLNVNDDKPSASSQQPPSTNDGGNNDRDDGKKQDGDGSKPSQDYSADIKSVNDKMSGMEQKLGQLTEALNRLQNTQGQPTQQKPPQEQGNGGKQGQQMGDEQEGDDSLAPSSGSAPTQPPPYNPPQGNGMQPPPYNPPQGNGQGSVPQPPPYNPPQGNGTQPPPYNPPQGNGQGNVPQPPPYNPPQGNAPQPQPNPQQKGRNQVNWNTLSSADPTDDAFSRELNKLTGNYLDKWDDDKGGFNDRGFWQMMQNKYGYQNPDVRGRQQQQLDDSASLQAYRAQQMADEGKDFYGEQLEQRTATPTQDWQGTKKAVQDLNRVTYDDHARMLGRNLGVDVKYDTDASGNTNFYYDQNVDAGRRLPGETDGDMLQRLRRQYGDNVQMSTGPDGRPQFSIRRSLGNGPSYVSGSNPIGAWANSQMLRAGRDVKGMQFKSPQDLALEWHDKYVKPYAQGVSSAAQRASQAWNNTGAGGGGFFQKMKNAWNAFK